MRGVSALFAQLSPWLGRPWPGARGLAAMANWEEEMLATMGDGSDPGGSSDDNWSDIDGGELLGLDSPGNAGTAAPPAPMIDLGDSASSIGSDAFGVMPDAFASQPVAAATAHVAAPALAPAPAPAADDVRTRSGEDELDALAQMAQKLGFDPHASPARATVSNPFDAPASTPASIPGGMYRCVADAAATAEFEPDPATVTIERMYRPGEAFYVSEIRATAAGKQRAHTLDGAWVSLKSENGFTLLEPVVDDPFDDNPFDDQPPDSPGDANPFSAAPSGDQTDTNPFSADDDLGPALFPAPQPAPAAATVVAAPVEAVKQTSKKQLAEVVHNFEAESDGDLALTVGDIVVLTKAKEGEAWWKGYIQGNKKVKGLFPASFVQVLEPEPVPEPETESNPFSVDPAPAAATVVAAPVEAVKQTSKKQLAEVVHNFEAESDGDLALTVGDIVVLTKAKEGEAWWKGYIQGNKKVKGLFPASFVQVLEPEPAPAPAPPPQSGEHCILFLKVLMCRPSVDLFLPAAFL